MPCCTCRYPVKQLLTGNDPAQPVPGAPSEVVHPQVDILRLWGHVSQTFAALSAWQFPIHDHTTQNVRHPVPQKQLPETVTQSVHRQANMCEMCVRRVPEECQLSVPPLF